MTSPPRAPLVLVRALAEDERALRGAARVAAQRTAARALRAEAALAVGACDGPNEATFAQAEDGRPLPTAGWHWSLSHGGFLVAACVHRALVGVDVEPIATRRADVVARALSDEERTHLPDPGAFTRAWTAKEAVLKATTLGLGALSRCRIIGSFEPAAGPRGPRDFDEGRLVQLDGVTWRVFQRELDGHVVAVAVADAEPPPS